MGILRPGHGRREHPELTFDPLDDSNQWPESQFPLLKMACMVLNRTHSPKPPAPVNLASRWNVAAMDDAATFKREAQGTIKKSIRQ